MATAIVTGASRGLGPALARAPARRGRRHLIDSPGPNALDQLGAVLAAERPRLRVYTVDPGDMRTQMHQEAYPGEDISDRPPPEESVPGILALIDGDLPSGRYRAAELVPLESS